MKKSGKTNIGLIGCGSISSIYFEAPSKFDILNIIACADLNMDRAQAKAKQYNIPKVYSVESLLADPDIDVVLNLTVPKAHAEICSATIQAGKIPYSEKPLGINREQGIALLDQAKDKNIRIGCAPDTFLGGGIQTCIKLIDDGVIGNPLAATAFMMEHGPENEHEDPDFFYQPGGGPLLDMGPYYLTALIAMLGPIRRVTGSTRISFPERIITSQPKYGTKIQVNTPTHIAGILDFYNGAICTIITSFDVWSHQLPHIEIYGTEGTLVVPDPNFFGGTVYLRYMNAKKWETVPFSHGHVTNCRGLGLADMACAMQSDRPHRANGDLAYHVLDVMQAMYEASDEGKHIELKSKCDRPQPFDPKMEK